MLLLWSMFDRIRLECSHHPEEWLGLSKTIFHYGIQKSMIQSCCAWTSFPRSLFLQNRKSTISTEKAVAFHSHHNIPFIFKKTNQHSRRPWFQCKLHVLILFKMSSGNYWTSSLSISFSMYQAYTGMAQEYIAIPNISVVRCVLTQHSHPSWICLVDKV